MFIEAGYRYCLGVPSKSSNFVVLVVCMTVIMIGATAGMASVSTSMSGVLMFTGVGWNRSFQYANLAFIEAICAANELSLVAAWSSIHPLSKSLELASE